MLLDEREIREAKGNEIHIEFPRFEIIASKLKQIKATAVELN